MEAADFPAADLVVGEEEAGNMKYFFGILSIVLGAVLVIKTSWFVENFGTSAWAEAHFGGGTYTWYKLVGMIIIVVAMLVMTGLFGPIFLNIFGRLFGL